MSTTGGPAFPVYDHHGDGQEFIAGLGLTKRECFAMAAMQGILAGQHPITRQQGCEQKIADAAVGVADALLEALEK